MPGVSRRFQSTRCSFCLRACKFVQVLITARRYGGTWTTTYRLCAECGDDTLKRLLARPAGRLV